MAKKVSKGSEAGKRGAPPVVAPLVARAIEPDATADDYRRCCSTIGSVVSHALGAVAAGDFRTSGAQRFLSELSTLVDQYLDRVHTPSRRNAVLSAVRLEAHVLYPDGRSGLSPSFLMLASEILWDHREAPDFHQQTWALSKQLFAHFDGWNRLPIDPLEAAEEAFKVAGIDSFNALHAAERMRMSRERSPRATGPKRQPRTPRRRS